MEGLDVAVTRWVNGWAGSSAALDLLMIWSSAAGIPLMVVAVAGQWWLRAERRHVRHVLIAAGLAFLLALALSQVATAFIPRPRPYVGGLTTLLIAPSADLSFPSDHATASFAIAAAFLLHGFRRRGLAFLAAAFLISLSRVYVGTHYISDVLGGAALGVAAAAAVRALYPEGTRLDRFLTGIL